MKMNKIVIVGNGFDLAHGLKSSYQDFIVDYLNSIIARSGIEGIHDDGLVKIVVKVPVSVQSALTHPSGINNFIKQFERIHSSNRIILNDHFKKMIEGSGNNWTDIEIFYYGRLVSLWNGYKMETEPKAGLKRAVGALNDFMKHIKFMLGEYLSSQQLEAKDKKGDLIELVQYLLDVNTNNHVCFLNYNYSNILSNYIDFRINSNVILNHIHGKLGEGEKIIFGYGDLDDPVFLDFEKSGINEFLHHVKHYEYTASSNYRDLIGLLEAGKFEVVILGHSCGLSDKLTLSSIFTHKNCANIRYYYYDKGNGVNDYKEKVYAIGRLLPVSHKSILPKIMVPFSESQPLVKAK